MIERGRPHLYKDSTILKRKTTRRGFLKTAVLGGTLVATTACGPSDIFSSLVESETPYYMGKPANQERDEIQRVRFIPFGEYQPVFRRRISMEDSAIISNEELKTMGIDPKATFSTQTYLGVVYPSRDSRGAHYVIDPKTGKESNRKYGDWHRIVRIDPETQKIATEFNIFVSANFADYQEK